MNLLELVGRHALGVRPDSEAPLTEHIRERYALHAALVDALDRRDRETLMRLIAQHDTNSSADEAAR
ncbi:hypothetical protein ABZT45_47385 [Streptomyces sp. NPDC005356]|uniref:hypothetical protein n=1 Tax=unclassified Streptomyces TaxID=2593676 RepID=UPI0033A32997